MSTCRLGLGTFFAVALTLSLGAGCAQNGSTVTGTGAGGGAAGSGGSQGSAGVGGASGSGQGGGASGTGGDSAGAGAAGTAGVGGTGGAAGGAGTGGASGAGTGGAAGGASGRGGAAGGRGGSGGTGAGGVGAAGAGGRGGTTGAAGTGTGGSAGTAGSGGTSSRCTTPPAASALIGWASMAGMNVTTTTGGGNATPQTVTTVAELNAAVAGTNPAVIYVSGVLPNGVIEVGSNKSIVGLCGAEIHGHMDLNGSSNVIIRNLKIVGYAVGDCSLDPTYDSTVGCSSGYDAVTIIYGAHHIWVDHCDISDGTDGNLDVSIGSDFVTISWTKFHYTSRTDPIGNDSTGAYGHRFSNLVGGADNLPS